MDKRLVILLVAVILGAAMISMAAFATRTSDAGLRSGTAMGSLSNPGAFSGSRSDNNPAFEDLLGNMQGSGGTYGNSLSTLQYLRQIMGSYLSNTSHRFGFNVSISRAVINGTLSYLVNNEVLVKNGQDLYRVLVPSRLYDGEKALSIQELVFLGELRKDDQLSIKAVNATIVSSKGEAVGSIYIATEINDLSTGRIFTAISPLNTR